MKTIKLLCLVCLMGCFSISISNAQGIKTTCITVPFNEFMDCPGINETITGDLTQCLWVNGKNKGQMKIYGELEGLTSGDIYTVNEVINQTWIMHKVDKGYFQTWNDNITFHLYGKLVLLIHENYHATINADFEPVVEFDHWVIECK